MFLRKKFEVEALVYQIAGLAEKEVVVWMLSDVRLRDPCKWLLGTLSGVNFSY